MLPLMFDCTMERKRQQVRFAVGCTWGQKAGVSSSVTTFRTTASHGRAFTVSKYCTAAGCPKVESRLQGCWGLGRAIARRGLCRKTGTSTGPQGLMVERWPGSQTGFRRPASEEWKRDFNIEPSIRTRALRFLLRQLPPSSPSPHPRNIVRLLIWASVLGSSRRGVSPCSE
jgi:hypothetical protein